MKWLARAVSNRYVLTGVSALLLIGLVLALGAWLDWALSVQLVLVSAVLLLCATALAIATVRASRKSAALEGAIQAQADRPSMRGQAEHEADVERLEENFAAAIETLKASRLGQRGRAALYALPWYMVIGPPAAGKTIAIMNSGFDFPLGVDRVRGIGGTRDCDWFFADEAIFLDTAGRYTTESEDADEWLAFLEILRRHRSNRPINGAIVAFSLADLITADPDEIDEHAAHVRHRIDELVRHLGVRFPVYVLFTKGDLLQGFVEFFGGLPAERREELWGCTFDETPSGVDVGSVFRREFGVLCRALANARDALLRRGNLDDEVRRRLYLFPRELEATGERIERFLAGAFQPNPYQERPIFRGFYFSSGTQEGAPLDPVTQAVTEAFNLPTDYPEGFDPEMRTRSYFLKGLFRDLIVPDQHLVEESSRTAKRKRLTLAAATIGGVALLALFLIGATSGLVESRQHLAAVDAATRAAAPVTWKALPTDLERVEQLRVEVDEMVERENRGPSLGWGFYRGSAVLPPAQDLYEQKVRALVERRALTSMEAALRSARTAVPVTATGSVAGEASDGDTPTEPASTGGPGPLYDDLRAYMLMTQETERLEDEVERFFLARHLLDRIGARDLAASLDVPQDSVRVWAQRQVAGYVEGLAADRIAPFGGDSVLVKDVRTLVYEPPSPDRLYARIREEARVRMPGVTLTQALLGRHLDLFSANPRVSGFYTQRGWEGFVEEAIEKQAGTPDRLDWVMGYSATDLPASMRDRAALEEALRTRYFSEYGQAWDRFLGSIRLRLPSSPDALARALTVLGDASESPILYALAQATHQTRFNTGDERTARALEGAERVIEGQARRRLGRAGRAAGGVDVDLSQDNSHPVNRKFAWLHALDADKAQSGGASPALVGALGAIAEAGVQLGELTAADASAAEFVARAQNGGTFGDGLRRVRNALPSIDRSVRGALFESPFPLAWGAAVGAAQRHLDQRWQAEVVAPYRAGLAGRYPLDQGAQQEAPLEQFEQFFRPETGTLASFYNEVMDPYMSGGGAARTWQGRGVGISDGARAAVADADRIGRGLFSGDVLQLRYEMQPDLPTLAPDASPVGQVYLEANGGRIAYGMGSYRPWTEFVWPTSPDAVLRVTTRDGERAPLRFSGDWAWFRLLGRADVQARSATEYEVRWPLESGTVIRFDVRTRSAGAAADDRGGAVGLRRHDAHARRGVQRAGDGRGRLA